MSEFLFKSEINQLTNRVKFGAQGRVLQRLKIPYATRPDGSLVVSRDAAISALGGNTGEKSKALVKLDLDAI